MLPRFQSLKVSNQLIPSFIHAFSFSSLDLGMLVILEIFFPSHDQRTQMNAKRLLMLNESDYNSQRT